MTTALQLPFPSIPDQHLMNIIQLQPGDIVMMTGVRPNTLQKAYRDALRTILPTGVHILVIGEAPDIIRRPDHDATAAYLEARKAEQLDGTAPKEGGHFCTPDTGKEPDITGAQFRSFLSSLKRIAGWQPIEPFEFTTAFPPCVQLAMPPNYDRAVREHADATAILVQHRRRDGSPIPSDEIRSAIRAAEVTARDSNFLQELRLVIQHRGYLTPEARDLTEPELYDELRELSYHLPVTFDHLRQQAANVGRLTGTSITLTNRQRLSTVRALHGLSGDHNRAQRDGAAI